MKITAEAFRALANYDPKTGILSWKVNRGRMAKKGDVLGRSVFNGRCQVIVCGKAYSVQNLAWLHFYGNWPEILVDHIDGNPLNNKISNLRACNHAENNQNTLKYKNNTTGWKGVDFHKKTQKYRARISAFGKSTVIGYFDTAEAAGLAYLDAKKIHHKFNPTQRG